MPFDYFHISFDNTGMFQKFPFVYSDTYNVSLNTYLDNSRTTTCEKPINEYDPRCRPFYLQTNSEILEDSVDNIVSLIVPYLFITGRIGSEICINALDRRSNIKTNQLPNTVICVVYSFDNLYLIISLSKKLDTNNILSIVFFKPNTNIYKLSTIYHSILKSDKFISYGDELNKTSLLNGEIKDADDLFETIFHDIFKKMYNVVENEKRINNLIQKEKYDNLNAEEYFIKMYEEIDKFYIENIYSRVLNISSLLNNTSNNFFTNDELNNFVTNSEYGYTKLNYTYVFDEIQEKIVKQENVTYIYIAPVLINSSLTSSYSLGDKRLADFYLVFIRNEKVSI